MRPDDSIFLNGNVKGNHHLETGFCGQKEIMLGVKNNNYNNMWPFYLLYKISTIDNIVSVAQRKHNI
jgi:hypothetical protein